VSFLQLLVHKVCVECSPIPIWEKGTLHPRPIPQPPPPLPLRILSRLLPAAAGHRTLVIDLRELSKTLEEDSILLGARLMRPAVSAGERRGGRHLSWPPPRFPIWSGEANPPFTRRCSPSPLCALSLFPNPLDGQRGDGVDRVAVMSELEAEMAELWLERSRDDGFKCWSTHEMEMLRLEAAEDALRANWRCRR
jgi:hypothetical protein